MLPMAQALKLCNDSVGSGDSSSQSYYNNVGASCILDMKYLVNPSLGLTAEDVVRFCVETNPSVYVTDEEEMHRHVGSREAQRSMPAECYKQASNLKIGSSSSVAFSVKQRLELCSNAPASLGPINCTLSALENGRDPTSKLKASELPVLCSIIKTLAFF